VAVIGGGNSGVEAAIDLAGIVSHVTLLEFDSRLRADAVLQAKLTSLPNVTVHQVALTTEVVGDGQKVTGIAYKDRVSGEVPRVDLEGIFVQIGLLPNTDWLKGTALPCRRAARSKSTRAAKPRCPASSPPAMRPPCPTSRSSSPWAKAPRPVPVSLRSPDPQPGAGRLDAGHPAPAVTA
jgi:hypothetical protein